MYLQKVSRRCKRLRIPKKIKYRDGGNGGGAAEDLEAALGMEVDGDGDNEGGGE